MLLSVLSALNVFLSSLINVCPSGPSVWIWSILKLHLRELNPLSLTQTFTLWQNNTRKQHRSANIQLTVALFKVLQMYARSQTSACFFMIPLSSQWLVYPHKYFCILKTASFWTEVCLFDRNKQFSAALCGRSPVFICLTLSFPCGLSSLLCSSCSIKSNASSLSLFFSSFLFLGSCSLHPCHPLCLPPTVSLASLSPHSWTHVGLIELKDPALIKGRVWLNTSKPPRLQSLVG